LNLLEQQKLILFEQYTAVDCCRQRPNSRLSRG